MRQADEDNGVNGEQGAQVMEIWEGSLHSEVSVQCARPAHELSELVSEVMTRVAVVGMEWPVSEPFPLCPRFAGAL